MPLNRRTLTLGLTALPLAAPAQSTPFAAALDRAQTLDQLHCLAIAHRGEVVLAEALRGPAPDRPVNVKSVSKTVVAALAGVAIDQGVLPSTNATLAEIAPDLIPGDADPRTRDITIADLLSLQAGLERTSGPNYGAWVSSRNWVTDALSRPMIAEPGTRMLYSTGTTHVLGAALSSVTGRTLLNLARDWLGTPLGIDIPAWTRDPQGRYLGGNEMALSPLALIRLGETFRQGGVWQTTRIVSEAYVQESFTPRTRSPFSRHDYGYGWFLTSAGGNRVAYARGYGGQMIYVLPALDLTVAITSDPTRPARSHGYAGDLFRLLEDTIVPDAAA
ncbi:MAG: serine hydrolase [Pseudomonadota bacterium]